LRKTDLVYETRNLQSAIWDPDRSEEMS
jgi:hypothetical protein